MMVMLGLVNNISHHYHRLPGFQVMALLYPWLFSEKLLPACLILEDRHVFSGTPVSEYIHKKSESVLTVGDVICWLMVLSASSYGVTFCVPLVPGGLAARGPLPWAVLLLRSSF